MAFAEAFQKPMPNFSHGSGRSHGKGGRHFGADGRRDGSNMHISAFVPSVQITKLSRKLLDPDRNRMAALRTIAANLNIVFAVGGSTDLRARVVDEPLIGQSASLRTAWVAIIKIRQEEKITKTHRTEQGRRIHSVSFRKAPDNEIAYVQLLTNGRKCGIKIETQSKSGYYDTVDGLSRELRRLFELAANVAHTKIKFK